MRHEEENMQMTCVQWMGWQHPELSPLLHHSPNGGRRHLREAQRFKAMGTRAGFPDLVLMYPSAGCHGLAVEMKSAKGTQTPEQRAWQQRLEANGYRYRLCRSLDEFRAIIGDYLTTK